MDNIESWSRTRRASAHSIGLSSRSNSRSSSAGPSSFTDNLTFYMNENEVDVQSTWSRSKQRKQDFSLPSSEKAPAPDLARVRSPKTDAVNPCQQSHNYVQIKHGEVRNDTGMLNPDSLVGKLHPPLSNRSSQPSDLASIAIQDDTMELGSNTLSQAESDHHVERLVPEKGSKQTADIVRQSSTTHSLQIDELKNVLTQQAQLLQQSQIQAAEDRQKLLEFEERLRAKEREQDHRNELDDQSLIEELEDDLERTCHELDRIIKDKKRMERQLEGTQADLNYERQRNKELEKLLAQARVSTSLAKALQPPPVTSKSESGASTEMVRGLKSALDQACLKIEVLEKRLLDRENDRLEERNEPVVTTSQLRTDDPGAKETQISVDVAEIYIRKIKAQKHLLREKLRKIQLEGEEFKRCIREDEKTIQFAADEIRDLKAKISELEVVKDRMGRVLMYQWGKEEVGQIRRTSHDGKKEQGMGYRYKYYKKDGTTKDFEERDI